MRVFYVDLRCPDCNKLIKDFPLIGRGLLSCPRCGKKIDLDEDYDCIVSLETQDKETIKDILDK